jgi:MFS family permease
MRDHLRGLNPRAWLRGVEYYRRVIIFAGATFLCELGFSTVNISTLPVYLSEELHAVQWLGVILGLQMLFDTLSQPFLGALGDRIGRRWIVATGPLLSAVTAAVTVYIPIGALLLFRILDGLARGAMWISVYAQTGDITDKRHRNTAMSIINIAYIMALALGPLTGGLLDTYLRKYFRHIGQPAFLFSSLCLMIGAVVALRVFPAKAREPGPRTARSPLRIFKEFDLLYTVRTFPHIMVLGFLIFCGLGLIVPLIKLYALDRYGISSLTFGYVLAIESILVGLMAVPLSRIGTHWGAHRAVFLGLVWITAALWMLTYSRVILLVFVSAGLIGMGIILALPAWLTYITQISPPHRKGEVLGVIGFSQGVGMLIGSSLAGILFALKHFRQRLLGLNAVNLPFFVAAVVMALSVLLSYWWVYRAGANFGEGEQG